MTLILAIPAKDGIVIGSDSQVTYNDVRWQEKKIKKLNEHCLWSAAGELALIQRVEESIDQLSDIMKQPLLIIRDTLSDIVMQSITTILQHDFRTRFIQPPNPELLLSLHPADFVFVEWLDSPKILHLLANGTTEWISKPFACGSGASFAYALLQKYKDYDYDLQIATVLAYKVLEESIETGSWGLGYPIDIWQISNNGIHNLSDNELAALRDTTRGLRESEINLLLSISDRDKHSLP
jgi:20S proteasome alpha/beta subunit